MNIYQVKGSGAISSIPSTFLSCADICAIQISSSIREAEATIDSLLISHDQYWPLYWPSSG